MDCIANNIVNLGLQFKYWLLQTSSRLFFLYANFTNVDSLRLL